MCAVPRDDKGMSPYTTPEENGMYNVYIKWRAVFASGGQMGL